MMSTRVANMKAMILKKESFEHGPGSGYGWYHGDNQSWRTGGCWRVIRHERQTARGRGGRNTVSTRRRCGGEIIHTHGNCTHSIRECKTPRKEHKETKSFGNMIGRNQQGCDWLLGLYGYQIAHKLTNNHYKSIISPNKNYTVTSNRYDALVDTSASHSYLDEDAIPSCTDIKPTFEPQVKVANGNLIAPKLQE